ncbi:hypothetical protein VKT23_005549 [Stygiomarasmius scandens]|uniref:Polysaccharide lyase family 8 protein n=1 Tax=Marasmiellus scandens TaxID=2682957 RepID=A0ABR1JQF3_9AGAR
MANSSIPRIIFTIGLTIACLPLTIQSTSGHTTIRSFHNSRSSSPTNSQSTAVANEPGGDIDTLYDRRLAILLDSLSDTSNVSAWTDSLNHNGQWPDIDYTTGCAARRANWPARDHWVRIATMAGVWRSNLRAAKHFTDNDNLVSQISLAMDWWFARDFTNPACLDSGGTDVIGIPEEVGQSCLLMDPALAPRQRDACSHMTLRSYERSFIDVLSIGALTGANTLDVAAIGIDNALLNLNASLLTDAFARVHAEVAVRNATKADGVRPDGSFGQHAGLLYNGNYGKDYIADVVQLELEGANTQYSAPEDSRRTVETLMDGNAWMIIRNTITGVLHWDLSVLGRFISFPVIDQQATGSINLNLTEIQQLGQDWSSQTLVDFVDHLSRNVTSANAGQLEGNRMFYTNDYMVNRGSAYVSTVKMYSARTKNTECTNSQNPFGFHLADGATFTYLKGDEYEDIAASWDWQLIPGTVVDYGATPLSCGHASFTGKEKLVGGVSNGRIGIAVMQYTNPFTDAFSWKKAHFFLDDDVQHVMISDVTSISQVPVYSVLDQKRHTGDIFVDGIAKDGQFTLNATGSSSLWHGGIGYTFDPDVAVLSLEVGPRTGNWSTIGISVQPPSTVDLFVAKLQHAFPGIPISYTAYPGTNFSEFVDKSRIRQLVEIQNTGQAAAVYDEDNSIAMVMFWDENGGVVGFESEAGPFTISASGNIALIYELQTGTFTVADPSQTLSTVDVSVDFDELLLRNRQVTITLPTGGLAGSSITE